MYINVPMEGLNADHFVFGSQIHSGLARSNLAVMSRVWHANKASADVASGTETVDGYLLTQTGLGAAVPAANNGDDSFHLFELDR